jgi:hypothetical protein
MSEVLSFVFHVGENQNIIIQATREENAVCVTQIFWEQAIKLINTEYRECIRSERRILEYRYTEMLKWGAYLPTGSVEPFTWHISYSYVISGRQFSLVFKSSDFSRNLKCYTN